MSTSIETTTGSKDMIYYFYYNFSLLLLKLILLLVAVFLMLVVLRLSLHKLFLYTTSVDTILSKLAVIRNSMITNIVILV